MAAFDGSGGFIAFSSELHIVHSHESLHIKGKPWNTLKAAASTFQKIHHPPPPLNTRDVKIPGRFTSF